MAAPAPTPAPAPQVVERATSCTFSGANGAAAASASQQACPTIVLSNVAVPAGNSLDLSNLKDNTHVIFEGETTWGYSEWAALPSTPTVLAGGDGKGSNSGKTKPKFFAAHGLTNANINNLHILNTPVQAVSINGANGLTITDMTIDSSDGDSQGGHNTDGFDISDSTNVVINGAKVYNQDDCVAINSGTEITFENGLCSGGHGLSIGSVGGRSDNTVQTVTFYNSQVKNSVNGIRVKGTEGTTGKIAGVTYNKITLSGITGHGILIEQNYKGGDLVGTATSGVPITDLTIEHIIGTGAVSSSAYDVIVTCGSSTSCTGWTWTDVNVTGGKKYASCTNVPSGVSCS
ncbi:glycoside hydrolase, family 28 [Grosmannia clavigera kw1407]|uniref:endo-polygalacturonase n=1 Tax=Grosmannia clavigera (strain kw1407 / UAMH 11150) TaxID=655863 RepID=F0XH55_GROCL|nr:glycoside hydrolase, family 28 [Grosmannia clavigera kw1407]EFX03127.1 glycoside hydrolase, family 28 [Grosmannia clavigera kw1407]